MIEPPRLLPLFLRDKAAVPSGILVRRQIIEQLGGFEDSFRGEYEDQVFCAKICLSAPIFASGQCWYRYRQHPDSCVLTGQRTGETNSARLRFLKDRWARRLELVKGVRILTSYDPQQSCGLANFSVEGIEPAKLVSHLWERYRTIVTPIKHEEFKGIRVTPNVYTTLSDIDTFCDAVEKAIRSGLAA